LSGPDPDALANKEITILASHFWFEYLEIAQARNHHQDKANRLETVNAVPAEKLECD
jgi:hypothetical protein